MKKITYFDVEYANSRNKSICQIGIICEDFETGEPVYPELNIYINPEDGFDENCIKVHGITEKTVCNKPTFPQVWETIEKYFVKAIVVGHNVASSDLDALVKNLRRYDIDIPEMYYICTYNLSKQVIPSFAIPNYSLSALCDLFDIDIDSEHDAFDDACACGDLFKELVTTYELNIEHHIQKYDLKETREYSTYVASPVLRKSISEFYGIIRGFSIDNQINDEEIEYISRWKLDNEKYCNYEEIRSIISVIDEITSDGIVTIAEISKLQTSIKTYLDIVSSSPITLATQILDGILKGITVDGEISEAECVSLRQWLYDNIYLSDHFPFDKAIKTVDSILEDSIVTAEESAYLTDVINEMLNPIDALKEQVNSVDGKSICLSGNFAYGPKSKVENYIKEQGGSIDSSVKKTTHMLIIGTNESLAYSNGTYGTKVKKAIDYNNKGCSIQIVREEDFFGNIK